VQGQANLRECNWSFARILHSIFDDKDDPTIRQHVVMAGEFTETLTRTEVTVCA
jgi:hypothetical protein